jgi:hypothetical protein
MQLKPPAIGLHSDFVIGQTPNASMNPETATRDSEFLQFKECAQQRCVRKAKKSENQSLKEGFLFVRRNGS